MRMAHDLKSITGTLALWAIHPVATELERACRDHAQDSDVEALVATVAQLLDPVLGELQALGPSVPSRQG